MEQWVLQAYADTVKKLTRSAEKNRDKIPYTTKEDGSYNDCRKNEGWDINWWTNGFWGGTMWMLWEDTKEPMFMEIARENENALRQCFTDFYGLNHDVGFMYLLTAGADYRLTGSETGLRDMLHAANLLAGRFNPAGNFIRAWNGDWAKDRGWAIIDCMMNLALLYRASGETHDPRFANIAMKHADTVTEAFIREDGSCCHIVEFDPVSGKRLCSHGGQGFGHGSSWTRGQAWALYGFTISYLHTKEKRFLDAAVRIAEYCMANVPENGIIPCDFRQPAEPAWEDSCGAAIMAGGFIELSKCVDTGLAEQFLCTGKKILKALALTRADYSEACDAVIQNCSASYHEKKHHITMVYADYFFLEALRKLMDKGTFLW